MSGEGREGRTRNCGVGREGRMEGRTLNGGKEGLVPLGKGRLATVAKEGRKDSYITGGKEGLVYNGGEGRTRNDGEGREGRREGGLVTVGKEGGKGGLDRNGGEGRNEGEGGRRRGADRGHGRRSRKRADLPRPARKKADLPRHATRAARDVRRGRDAGLGCPVRGLPADRQNEHGAMGCGGGHALAGPAREQTGPPDRSWAHSTDRRDPNMTQPHSQPIVETQALQPHSQPIDPQPEQRQP